MLQWLMPDIVLAPEIINNFSSIVDTVVELLNKVNDGLAKIKANGKYAEIYKKWFGKEPPAEDLK